MRLSRIAFGFSLYSEDAVIHINHCCIGLYLQAIFMRLWLDCILVGMEIESAKAADLNLV